MDMNVYQNHAIRTTGQSGAWSARVCCAMGLAGETGELVDIVKKWAYHDHPRDIDAEVEELGDILWYLAVFAAKSGYSLDQIAERNIEKLRERYPHGFDSQRSIERRETE